jgi:hypothetical protein
MVVYTSAKCGHCGEIWTSLNPNTPNTVFGKIGPPIIRCSHCFKDNITGYKLKRDLNYFEQLIFLDFKKILAFILALGFIGAAFWIFNGVLSSNMEVIDFFGLFLGGYFLYIAFNGIKNNLTMKSDLDYLEEVFDKNGGFIWSYEIYGV